MFIEVCSARESLGFTPVGAGLGLGGMLAIRPMRAKVNRVQPYRPNAPPDQAQLPNALISA